MSAVFMSAALSAKRCKNAAEIDRVFRFERRLARISPGRGGNRARPIGYLTASYVLFTLCNQGDSMPAFLKAAAAAVAIVVMSGCAMQSPPYDVSVNNISALKKSAMTPTKVGAFQFNAGAPGALGISMRGSTMSSSVGQDYAAYLGEALRQELDMAKKLNPQSVYEISGTVLGTDIDAAIGTASGYMEARFVVKKDGSVRFDKVKRSDRKWESSFAAAVALPEAQRNYPLIVQDLLSGLYADTDFQNALK
ncbi:MAG: hypothetical protein QM742_17695 [Aquabacterium sp.]